MTKRKANKWLKSVKGRKIRRDYWHEGEYVIPTGEWKATSDSDTYYWDFWCINEKGEKDWHFIRNGFEESKYVAKWQFVETDKDRLEELNSMLLAHLILKGVLK